jgi:hypothetical protein
MSPPGSCGGSGGGHKKRFCFLASQQLGHERLEKQDQSQGCQACDSFRAVQLELAFALWQHPWHLARHSDERHARHEQDLKQASQIAQSMQAASVKGEIRLSSVKGEIDLSGGTNFEPRSSKRADRLVKEKLVTRQGT